VAAVRGLLLAVVGGAIGAATTWATSIEWGDLAPWSVAAIALLRAAEGWVLDERHGRGQ
jgi:hypothetical protein